MSTPHARIDANPARFASPVRRDPGMFVLKSALRAAIVTPLAFALSLVVIDSKQMALFAAFGSMALLVFATSAAPDVHVCAPICC